MMVSLKDDSLTSFRHLFLKGYEDRRQGSYALYTKPAVYEHIHFIIHKVLTRGRMTSRSKVPLTLTTSKKNNFFAFSTSTSKS